MEGGGAWNGEERRKGMSVEGEERELHYVFHSQLWQPGWVSVQF